VDALFVRADRPVQLDFRDGRINVSNTCNRMGGTFTLQGTQLTIGNLASTMMACADQKLMALDSAVGKQLQGPQTTGDPLTFRGDPPA
jgi:heat shock protein HslJ